jgi:hypothetical protein
MNWRVWVRGALGGREDNAATGAADDAAMDHALRLVVRGEVAGAAPRYDAWQRLQQRIQAEQDRPALSPPALRSAWPFARPMAGVLLGRFSQLGVAAALLLLVLGDARVLERVSGPQGQLVGTPAQMRDDGAPVRAITRVNRADLLLNAPADARADAPAPPAEAPDPVPVHMTVPAPAEPVAATAPEPLINADMDPGEARVIRFASAR